MRRRRRDTYELALVDADDRVGGGELSHASEPRRLDSGINGASEKGVVRFKKSWIELMNRDGADLLVVRLNEVLAVVSRVLGVFDDHARLIGGLEASNATNELRATTREKKKDKTSVN